MGKELAVNVSNLTMRFNLAKEKTDTVKEFVLKLLKGQLLVDEFYALRNINLKVEKGDAVALIGINGSGKSTLLKCIAGVMYPTNGKIEINGSIAPLIELGAGFDMDLTARENIYLNGAILGHDRTFMDMHFDSIIDFAELRDFVDVPVKNFSSGMIARLGFAIATEVKTDILIVDEVLSVGDFRFQQKCQERIQDLLSGGTTLLFVSHSIEQVKEVCKKAAWIEHGELMAYGEVGDICRKYQEQYGW